MLLLSKEALKVSIGSRKTVFKIISLVIDHQRSLAEVLEMELSKSKLDLRDRAFIRLLATIVLRNLGVIDDLISHYLKREVHKQVKNILRMGVAQIVYLKTPPHAGVDTSVQLAEKLNLTGYKGLINAVLRKVAQNNGVMRTIQDQVKLNTPCWLWERWQTFYGNELCYQIAQANLQEAALDLTVKKDPLKWAEKIKGELLPTGSVRLKNKGLITEIEGFNTGDWWVQDASASLPVKVLGEIRGLRVADLCAAPGGKTAQLINQGAIVTAIDRSQSRMQKLEKNLARLNFTCEIIIEDAVKWFAKKKDHIELFDAVLVDAPCLATGTIRRNPDLVILKKPQDLIKINTLQKKLLTTAFEMVKPGGTVVYAVCSLEKEEGEACVEEILKQNHNVLLKPIKPGEFQEIDHLINDDDQKGVIIENGCVRILPFCLGGMDGFFMARFIRKV